MLEYPTLDLIVPSEARSILADVQRHSPKAAIVGGYLRDLAAGVPPKDIDIFVPTPFEFPMEFTCALQKVFHGGYGTGMRKEVKKVFDTKTAYLPVQLVENTARDGGEAMMQVDFDFCRIAFDGEKVIVGPGFARALETKTATCVLSDDVDIHRSVRRAERWQAGKFNDWNFMFPQGEYDV